MGLPLLPYRLAKSGGRHSLRLYSYFKWPMQKAENKKREVLRFSDSDAYFGRDKVKMLKEPLYIPDYYDSVGYKFKRLASALLSAFAVFVYIAWFRSALREPNDIDDLLNAPPYLISANAERRYLKEQIHKQKKAGNLKKISVLQAELDYMNIKEAAMRKEYEAGRQIGANLVKR